jgi:catechol 2,3-dioxygenase-like lactoylglutathione lyase family enzyme
LSLAGRRLAAFALLVRDYDEAIDWFCDKLDFSLVSDEDLGEGKRWVTIAPARSDDAALLLARAATQEQLALVGDQGAGRVLLFLETDDFCRDHARMAARGVAFLEEPRREAYGTVAVFLDLCGNRWDLIEPLERDDPAA